MSGLTLAELFQSSSIAWRPANPRRCPELEFANAFGVVARREPYGTRAGKISRSVDTTATGAAGCIGSRFSYVAYLMSALSSVVNCFFEFTTEAEHPSGYQSYRSVRHGTDSRL